MTNWSGPQLNGDRTKFKFPYLEDLKRQLRATNTSNIASNVEKEPHMVKKNLDGVFSMDHDFVKVLHPCESVAYLVSWILNIHIYWKFGVGIIPVMGKTPQRDCVYKFYTLQAGPTKNPKVLRSSSSRVLPVG